MKLDGLHDEALQESVLGSMLISRQACEEVIGVLRPEHFYGLPDQLIAETIWRMVAEGEVPTAVSVPAALRSADNLGRVGGPDRVVDLQGTAVSTTGAANLARRLLDLARLRLAYGAAREMADQAPRRGEDVDSFLAEYEAKLAEIRDAGTGQSAVMSWREAVIEMHARAIDPSADDVLPTGLHEVDDMMAGGFRPGELICAAARTSVGKTAFAVSVAANVAAEGGVVTYCTMEMDQLSIAQRMAAVVGQVDLQSMRKRTLNARQQDKLDHAVDRVAEWPIHVQESASQSSLDVTAHARRVRRDVGRLDLVIVDYVQQLRAAVRQPRRDLEIGDSVWALKTLAKDMGLPVLMLAQVNRQPGSRMDQRPQLHDLRECGSIEQDSDAVLMLHRDDLITHDSPKAGTAEVIWRKQRNGPTGTRELSFLGQYGRFANLARS